MRANMIHMNGAPCLTASVLTIGAFDGVHRGHQSLIARTVQRARALGTPAVVWTFDPPPKVFFGRAERIDTLGEKLERITRLGADHVVVSRFDEVCCNRPAEAFLQELAGVNPLEVWVGDDFRFGKGQVGDAAMLAQVFSTQVMAPVRCAAGDIVSSTRIRLLRRQGMIDAAGLLLGRVEPCSGSLERIA